MTATLRRRVVSVTTFIALTIATLLLPGVIAFVVANAPLFVLLIAVLVVDARRRGSGRHVRFALWVAGALLLSVILSLLLVLVTEGRSSVAPVLAGPALWVSSVILVIFAILGRASSILLARASRSTR